VQDVWGSVILTFLLCVPAGEDAEWAQEAMETGKDYYNWHDEERKISALQKEAKAEYEEWKQAEKAAEAQRALLAEYVQRADAEARAHAQRATMLSLQAYKGRRRMQVMKLVTRLHLAVFVVGALDQLNFNSIQHLELLLYSEKHWSGIYPS